MRIGLTTVLLVILNIGGTALAATNGQQICDEYMAKFGGPCLDGIPTDVYRSKPGVLPEAHRSIFGFTLGADDFDEAIRRFGPAIQWHSGDAGASEDKLCYMASGPKDALTVVLARNAEMSTRIDEIRMMLGTIESADQCARANWPATKIRTTSGLRPGIARSQIVALLGPASNEIGDQMYWNWETTKTLAATDPMYPMCLVDGVSEATQGSGVTARIKNGRVEWLVIGYGDFVC
jgi:hypothetical protein